MPSHVTLEPQHRDSPTDKKGALSFGLEGPEQLLDVADRYTCRLACQHPCKIHQVCS